jgi:uncharacterized membrane protein
MKCRQCGTEIADKAIICYRCGTATSEAKFKAPTARKARVSAGLLGYLLPIVLLALCALYLARLSSAGPADNLRWAILVLAVVLVFLRFRARRAQR